MTPQRITVERIALTLEGWPVAQAQLLAAQLQAAMAGQAPAAARDGLGGPPDDEAASGELVTRLAGPALVAAVAARLMARIGAAAADDHTPQEAPPWP